MRKRLKNKGKILNFILLAVVVLELILIFSVNTEFTGNAVTAVKNAIGVKSVTQKITCVPSTEICDGKDNDCDGQFDEGGVCEGMSKEAISNYEGDILISNYLKNQEIKSLPQINKEILTSDKINEEIKEKGALWTAKENSISKLSEEQKKILLGLIITDEELKEIKARTEASLNKITTPSFENLPDFFDWRNVGGKNYITSVKDQGQCGSCWAFGAIATLEGHVNAYYNNPNIDLNLSEQDLVSCFHGNGCDGANSDQIKQIFSSYLQNAGVSIESCFPYTATNNNCSNKCSNWQNDVWKTLGYQVIDLSGTIEDRANRIKQALIDYGPLEVGMTVYYDFFDYDGGIYSHTTDSVAGSHAVTIVGFGTYDGLYNYWVVKNSWGEEWGENGYFKILAGDSMIDSWFAFVITEPFPPTPQTKICTDNDKDGYCYWGLGNKPTTECPSCNEIKDCDDSNSSIFEGCGISTEPTGLLSVTSTPSDTEVYVKDFTSGNWNYRGNTPITFELWVGNREVKLSKEDYEDYFLNVNVSENQITYINSTLLLVPKINYPLINDIFRLGDILQINGTIPSHIINYTIEYELLTNPGNWNLICSGSNHITNGNICSFNTNIIPHNPTNGVFINLKLTANKNDGTIAEIFTNEIYLDPTLKEGWPLSIEGFNEEGGKLLWIGSISPVLSDLNEDNSKELVFLSQGYPGNFYGGKLNIANSNGEISKEVFIQYFLNPTQIPSIKDINGDNIKEILFYSWDKIFVLNNSGEIISIFSPFTPNYMIIWPNSLVIDDLNKDKEIEIIFSNWNYEGDNLSLVVLEKDGEYFSGFPLILEETSISFTSAPSVGDLDNDGYKEILIISGNNSVGSLTLKVYDYHGNLVWQKPVRYQSYSPPIIGDINSDGYKEVIITSDVGIHIYDKDGNLILDKILGENSGIHNSPALADLNNDGNLEIIFSYRLYVHAIYYNGTELFSPFYVYDADSDFPKNPIIGDVNGDSFPDIIFSSKKYIYALDKTGYVISGFPKYIDNTYISSPSIDDIDNDGQLELISSSNWKIPYMIHKGKIYVWDLNVSYDKLTMSWPQFQHDPQHTGCYDCDESDNSCTDTDGGMNYLLKGTASNANFSCTDHCVNATTLLECYCPSKKYPPLNSHQVNYICPGSCTNGECIICGDLNLDGNKFNLGDLMVLAKIINGTIPYPVQWRNGDMNGDGSLTQTDITIFQNYLYSVSTIEPTCKPNTYCDTTPLGKCLNYNYCRGDMFVSACDKCGCPKGQTCKKISGQWKCTGTPVNIPGS